MDATPGADVSCLSLASRIQQATTQIRRPSKEEIKGDSEHDVLRKAAEHAKTAHHMDSIPPGVLSKVKGAIHDQGEPRTQKAGSSN